MCFPEIKEALPSLLIVRHYDPMTSVENCEDASRVGIGAVLAPLSEDDLMEHAVTFATRNPS